MLWLETAYAYGSYCQQFNIVSIQAQRGGPTYRRCGARSRSRALSDGNAQGQETMIRIFNQYVSPKSVLLMFIESGLIALALLCGVRLRFWNSPDEMEALLQFPEIAE